MFTGIIETVGVIRSIRNEHEGVRLSIEATFETGSLVVGESISVDGPCLTVEQVIDNGFEVFASAETLARTTLKKPVRGRKVNLERAMRADGRFGGHFVSGHVDGVGRVGRMVPSGGARKVTIRAPGELIPYLTEKGSVSVNGVSLTVNGVRGTEFTLMLIPHTMSETTLSDLSPGDEVNLEADMLARYLMSFMEKGDLQRRRPVTPEMLEMLGQLDED